jgi:aspartyl-tRNA(Asn)/glutamyl-tRNA(Gln) amidotransferase subunit B
MSTILIGTLDHKRAAQIVDDGPLSAYFDAAVLAAWAFFWTDNGYWLQYEQEDSGAFGSPEIRPQVASLLLGEAARLANLTGLPVYESRIAPVMLGEIVGRYLMGDLISTSAAKKVLETLWSDGGSVNETITRLGLEQISDTDQIQAWVAETLAKNDKMVDQYRDGKTAVFGAMVGQVLKASNGRANPTLIKNLLEKALA